jgi:uncharacterized membrane protein
MLGSVWFLASAAVPYLGLDPERFGEYWPRRGWLLAHIAGGTTALLVGPVQVWLGLGRRSMNVHRMLGRVYVSSAALGSFAAFYLAFNTDGGCVFGMGLSGLAVAWITTTGLAYQAIQRRLITQHQEWMIRSYVVAFAFVTFRVFSRLLSAWGVGTQSERANAASWFCWAVRLLMTEAVLQGRKVFPPLPQSRSL